MFFISQCPDGYVGTGEECGKDSDLDGHPDNSLSTCLGFGCQFVSMLFMFTPIQSHLLNTFHS